LGRQESGSSKVIEPVPYACLSGLYRLKKHPNGCVTRLGLWLFVALCVSLPELAATGSPGQQSVTENAALAQAHEALRRGDWESAIRLLSDWLQKHPQDVAARLNLALAYQSSGDVGRAEITFQSVLKDDPRNVDALTDLGSIFEQQGRLEEAEPLLARAVKLQPASAATHLEWASVLARLHRYGEAAAALAGVPTPAPRLQRIAYERLKASVDLGMGDAKAAAHEMERALELAPGDKNLQLATGMAECEAGAWTAAIAHLAPAFAGNHDPSSGLALLQAELATHADHTSTLKELASLDLPPAERLSFQVRLGETLSHAALHAEAVQAFQKAIENGPERADLYFDLALAQFEAGQMDAALGSAQHSRTLGDSANLESLIGDIEEAQGDSLDAVHSYQAAVALAPDQEQYRLVLGLELLRHGTFEAALTVFQQTVNLFPKSTRARVAVGLTYYFLEQYPEAVKVLLEASQMSPKSELAFDYLGEIQLQQPGTPDPAAVREICLYADSHPDGAEGLAYCGALELRIEHDRGGAAPSSGTLERLQRAARLIPDNATARCGLGQALEWSQQWREAETQMQACIRLRPDSVEAHYRMANIARHLGETERAQEEMRLHDEAQQRMVEANAMRDRTLQKFLYTMAGSSSKN
jgi:tetratricopeptide (TPR) repeat protein